MEEKQPKRKFSFFEITAVILIVLLVVGIFVEIIVMVNLKNKIEETKSEESQLPKTDPEEADPVLNLYLQAISINEN